MYKKKKYQARRTLTIKDAKLAAWLIKQGCPNGYSSFGLSKSMGERVDLIIENKETVKLTFYGASYIRGYKQTSNKCTSEEDHNFIRADRRVGHKQKGLIRCSKCGKTEMAEYIYG